ncbi:transporter [Mycobacterium sp.]|uniref:PH-like domain-containing protein n=1 Tax=Mycobacterium sp. TaxID=1785 RepID=UPI003BACD402
MNSGTLFGSLVFATVLVVVIAVVTQLMLRDWRLRARRQAELVGDLPNLPGTVRSAVIATHGRYVGCTLAPSWNERVMVGDLGYRTGAILIGYQEGILVQRVRARSIWIPRQSITAVRAERGLMGSGAGAVAVGDGILVIRWRLPSGVQIDTGFRAGDHGEYNVWLEGWQESRQKEPRE